MERIKNLYAVRGASLYATSKVAGIKDDEDDEFLDEDDKAFEEEFDEDEEDDEGPGGSRRSPRRGSSSWEEDIGEDDTSSGTAGENERLAGGIGKESEEEQPWVPNLTPYPVFVGDRECKVYIEDESGKININVIDDSTRGVLVEYLIGQGFSHVEADTITDSVLDWKDGDELKHLNGAETDYYESLQEPYESKNAPFDSIEEFALIRGMTPTKFDKIRRDITIHGYNKAININFASKEVLLAIPRITPQGADYIIAHRTQNGPLNSMEDVRNLFWHLGIIGSSFEEVRPYITVSNSGNMTIRATCEANGVSSAYRTIIGKVNNKVNVFAVYPD